MLLYSPMAPLCLMALAAFANADALSVIPNADVRASKTCVPFRLTDVQPRILVTGGAGFIGSHLVARLLASDAPSTVKIVDSLHRGRLENLLDDDGNPLAGLSFENDVCIGDLTHYAVALKMTRHVDTIYHLADMVAGIDFIFDHQALVFERNMLINLNAVMAARTNHVPAFVYTATACSFPKELQASYFNSTVGYSSIPEEKLYPANPESSYGWSKLMGEYHLKRGLGHGSHRMEVGIARLHNVYGGRSPYRNGSQAIPALIRKAVTYPAEGFRVRGSGLQYRDFLHVDDAVSGE